MRPLLFTLITLCTPCVSPVWAQPPGAITFPPDSPLKAQFTLKTARMGMPAVNVGTSIYVIGGGTITGMSGSLERIDTTTNTVTTLPVQITPRRFHSAEAVGDSIYIFGGDNGVGLVDKAECFNTRTQKVTPIAPLPTSVRTPSSVAVDSKIYVVGGSDDKGIRLNSLWIYDTQTDEWTAGAPMAARRECDAVETNGTIYALGGFDGTSAIPRCEAYDIATNTWHDFPSMPIKTSAHHLAYADDSIWAFGDYEDMGRVQRFDIKTQTWQQLFRTGYDARRHAAVCTVDDKIYVIGGNLAAAGAYVDTVQVFDAKELK